MRPRTDTQTDTQTRVTTIRFASSTTQAKYNNCFLCSIYFILLHMCAQRNIKTNHSSTRQEQTSLILFPATPRFRRRRGFAVSSVTSSVTFTVAGRVRLRGPREVAKVDCVSNSAPRESSVDACAIQTRRRGFYAAARPYPPTTARTQPELCSRNY